jgi:hypothetical protein
LGSKQFAKRQPVDTGHLEVKCNQVATHTFQHTKGGSSFGSSHNTVLSSFEDFAEPFAGSGIVVNY